jgi:Na+-translocating ferredoxin:NAD+ oxidoreductase RNF subunit RnfB
MIQKFSLCGLGTAAPNPVLTTILYFRDMNMKPTSRSKMPGRRLQGAVRYEIDAEACTGCTLCFKKCPQDAVAGKKKSLMKSIRTNASNAASAMTAVNLMPFHPITIKEENR